MNAACPRRVSLIIAGGLPTIPAPTIGATTGDRPAASGSFPPRQASSVLRRLARTRRPNRVHGSGPSGPPALRTGRSRSGALHPVLPRRSSGSIPHGSSPHRSGLPPLRLPAFSGARRADLPVRRNFGRVTSAATFAAWADFPSPPGVRRCHFGNGRLSTPRRARSTRSRAITNRIYFRADSPGGWDRQMGE